MPRGGPVTCPHRAHGRLGGPRLSRDRVGNAFRLNADLPQLPERRRNDAAKEKAGLRCRSATDKRRSRCVQHASRLGPQRAEVWAEAGREDDRVKAFGGRLLEVDALAGKVCDIAPQLDPSVANRIEHSYVDEWYAPVFLDGLERPLGQALQAELFDRADREPEQGRVDLVRYSRGKQSAGEAPGEDRHSEQLPRDDVDRAADGERHVDARFAEVERDLAARGAKANNQNPFPGERGGIAITA